MRRKLKEKQLGCKKSRNCAIDEVQTQELEKAFAGPLVHQIQVFFNHHLPNRGTRKSICRFAYAHWPQRHETPRGAGYTIGSQEKVLARGFCKKFFPWLSLTAPRFVGRLQHQNLISRACHCLLDKCCSAPRRYALLRFCFSLHSD